MKRLVLLVALLTAGPAYAAPICFGSDPCGNVVHEQSFTLPDEELSHDLDAFWWEFMTLPMPTGFWDIPPFDFSLGIPEVLLIDIEGSITLSGQIHELDGPEGVELHAFLAHLGLNDSGLLYVGEVYVPCTAPPCAFTSEPNPFADSGWVLPDGSGGWEIPWWDFDPADGLTLPLPPWHYADTFFHLHDTNFMPRSASVTIRTHVTGVARATYVYEPFAEPVPEPATLLLLGSGLIGAEWKRRRRQR